MKKKTVSRRYFLMASGATLAGCATAKLPRARFKSPSEKLNVAAIGAGGKGASDIGGCASENVVALCDVDWKNAGKTFDKFPAATKYKDFREMLDKEKSLDAVTISTPDHTHAVAALWAMERGLHVYVQKPLTHNVQEARLLTRAARKYGVATQMGNQGHSGEGVRQLVEMVGSGVIGEVREVHAWTNRPIWPQGIPGPLPPATMPPPDTLDWNGFLGPAADRPYSEAVTPFKWRGFWDFGCGALGDMACHLLDSSNWALKLSNPVSVECVKQEGRSDICFPKKAIVKFEFAAREGMPPVTLFWYEGGLLPERPAGIPEGQKLGEGNNGSLFIGSKGIITTGTYSGGTRLLPDEKMLDWKPVAQTIPRVAQGNHYKDWIDACKGGRAACSNFDYAGPFTEWVLLGSIAQRFDDKLLWDGGKGQFTNKPEANQYLTREYRKGWELPKV